MEKKMIDFLHENLPMPNLEESKNVLCVLPHPDDGELGAGGTVAKLKSRGATVNYLLVTGGSAGIHGKSREETKEIRKKEQEKAAKILNVDEIIWLNYPDGGDYDVESVKKDLTKYLEKLNPDLVITVDPFLPYESHPDHRMCGLAVAQTLLFNFNTIPVAFFFTAYPNQFICIDKYWEKKFEAISAHKSQFDFENVEIYKRYFEMKRRTYGKKVGCKYAEGFKVLLPMMLHAFEEALWI